MMENQEQEILIELEAVQAMYGDDCVIHNSLLPHFHLHVKPRTADISSQQFVEAVLSIQAGPRYPEEPPHIDLVDFKGLDEDRKRHLITSVQEKALELSSCLMLVALCEEAVERLSLMNHPDGDCPLCLNPLVPEEKQSESLPFMKLMSCFHCFHSECIIRWWHWLQKEKEKIGVSSSASQQSVEDAENHNGVHGVKKESMGNCPVCRKVFHAEDLEHVLDLVETHSSELCGQGTKDDDEQEAVLQSDLETIQRERFERILNLQQENSGLIEPKKELVVLPGMFLPQPVAPPVQTSTKESAKPQRGSRLSRESNSGGSSHRHNYNRQKPVKAQWSEAPSTRESISRGSSTRRNYNRQEPVRAQRSDTQSARESNSNDTPDRRNYSRRQNPRLQQNARKQVSQWVRKENGTSN